MIHHVRGHAGCLAAAALVVVVAHGPAAAQAPRAPGAAHGERVHVIGKGDTLGSIAVRYRVSVTALVAANKLPGDRVKLRVGQRLVVPVASAATGPTRAAAKTAVGTAGGRRAPAGPRAPGNVQLAVPDFVDASPAFSWPVEGPVTSTFGRRRSTWHRGIDIKAEQGNAIFAAAAGTVIISGIEPRYGRVVKIEHEDGFVTVYAHNEENLVEPGAWVAAGDPIATIGRTGRATAHHLHFEIRRDGAFYNPLYLLPLPRRVAQVEESDESDDDHE